MTKETKTDFDSVVDVLGNPIRRRIIRKLTEGPDYTFRLSNEASIQGIATEIIDEMKPEILYILGPGTTIKPVTDNLGLPKTLLGVDVIKDKKLVALDVNEKQIIQIIKDQKVMLIVTIIGVQGFVFGRGNQQISPRVIRMIGRDNIVIISTPDKLASLKGHPLRVDTGDYALDEELKGYYKIRTGYARRTIYKVA